MVLNCIATDLKVLSKDINQDKEKNRTYYNVLIQNSSGKYETVACDEEVFPDLEVGKIYNLGFEINTFYLKKDYSIFIKILSASAVKK